MLKDAKFRLLYSLEVAKEFRPSLPEDPKMALGLILGGVAGLTLSAHAADGFVNDNVSHEYVQSGNVVTQDGTFEIENGYFNTGTTGIEDEATTLEIVNPEKVGIYDLLGRLVKEMPVEGSSVVFDGKNRQGEEIATQMLFARITGNTDRGVKKIKFVNDKQPVIFYDGENKTTSDGTKFLIGVFQYKKYLKLVIVIQIMIKEIIK